MPARTIRPVVCSSNHRSRQLPRLTLASAVAALVAAAILAAPAGDTNARTNAAPLEPQHSATSVLTTTASPYLGPPIASDLDSLHARRIPALAYHGGHITDLAMEPVRPIAWAARGARIVALDVSGNDVRELGQTPVLPEDGFRLAVGEGVVLAMARVGGSGAVWLVDGRDPTWPRDVRALRLGGPVVVAAVEGRQAALVVDEELIVLDFTQLDAPTELLRLPFPGGAMPLFPGGAMPVHDIVMRDGLIVVAMHDGVKLIDRRGDGEPAVTWLRTNIRPQRLAMTDTHLAIGNVDGYIHLYRLTEGLPELAADVEANHVSNNPPVVHFILTDRLLAFGERGVLRVIDLSDGDDYWEWPPLALDVDQWGGMALIPSTGDEHHVLVFDHGIRRVSLPKAAGVPPTQTMDWRPRIEPVYGTQSNGRDLAVMSHERLYQVDASQPESPQFSESSPISVDPRGRGGAAGHWLWENDRLWLHVMAHTSLYDMSNPRRPTRPYESVIGARGRVAPLGDMILAIMVPDFVVTHKGVGRFVYPGRLELGASGGDVLGVVDDVAWVHVFNNGGRTGTDLVSIDVSDPTNPTVLGTLALTSAPTSAEIVNSRTLALITEPRVPGAAGAAQSVLLTTVDIRNPEQPKAIGRLDFESATILRGQFHAYVHRHPNGLMLTFDDGRLIHVSLKVPEYPEETEIVTLPHTPWRPSVANGIVWTGTSAGELIALRPAGTRFHATNTVWMPVALGGR